MIRRLVIALVAAACLAGPATAAESLGELERRAKAFYDLLERGQKEQAAATFALVPDLDMAGARGAAVAALEAVRPAGV